MRNTFSGAVEKRGFVVYLDSYGEPLRLTQVTQDPDHGTGFSDMKCLDAVEDEPVLLLSRSGGLEPEGRDFCQKKGIAESVTGLLQYMGKFRPTPPEVRVPVKVGHALRFRK
jgi:hypothetical protein